MPHTHSSYQQDLGFDDGMLSFSVGEITPIGAGITLVRNAIGDYAYLAPVSATSIFAINILDTVLRRNGYTEDLQNVFGSTFGGGLDGAAPGPGGTGSGVPGSAEPQGRPGSISLNDGFILPGTPQPVSAMGALQQITPRTGLKIKGFKPLSINVIYKVLTGAATTLTVSLVQTVFKNAQAVATGQTTLLAAGQNGMTNVAAATPYVTNVPIPNAVYYQILPLTQLWFELTVVEPAANTLQFYGIDLVAEFNYN